MWINKSNIKKTKHQKQLDFQSLLNAPKQKANMDYKRRYNYYERNWLLTFGTKIREVSYCFECRSEQCCNNLHLERKIVLNPIIRVPRKNVSKLRWKQFMVEVKKFHQHRYWWLNGY